MKKKLDNGAYRLRDDNGIHAKYVPGNRLKRLTEHSEDGFSKKEGEETAKPLL